MNLSDQIARYMSLREPQTEAPKTGGFASLMPEGVDYAIQVAHEMDLQFRSRGVPLRLEPEHGPAPNKN